MKTCLLSLHRYLVGASVALVLWGIVPAHAQPPLTINVAIDKATFNWSWTQGTGGPADGFRMKCGAASGTYTLVSPPASGGGAARTMPLSGVVTAPGTYFCAVAAFNLFGESAVSNEVNFTAGFRPDAATGLVIVVVP